MKKFSGYFLCILFLLLFNFCFNFAHAETDINGDAISEDTTWTAEGSPYVIYGSTDINATLTIEPGTVIKFDYGQTMNILGKLIVEGQENNKVYFTSINDDSVGGDIGSDNGLVEPHSDDWGGFQIDAGGDIELNNVVISYAETSASFDSSSGLFENTQIANCESGMDIYGSEVNINNLDIDNINGDGFNVINNSNLSISNSNVDNISGDFLFEYKNSTTTINSAKIADVKGDLSGVFNNSSLDLENLDMNNVNGQILYMYSGSLAIINNSSINNAGDGVFYYINSILNISNSSIKNVTGEPFINYYSGSSLTLSNSTIKNISGDAIEAYGTSWGNYATTTLDISSSTISDGSGIGLEIFGDKFVANISKSIIQNFASDGIQTYSNSNINILSSNISNNDNGIMSWGANIEIENSIISANKNFGISNNPAESGAPEIIAKNNWWGDKSGPFNTDTNASGTANQVSSNVAYQPWLLQDPNKIKNPVIIIPGILSSYLNRESDNQEVWINLQNVVISSSDNYLDQLILNNNGQIDASGTNIVPSDIFRKIEINIPLVLSFKEDFFDGLINKLKDDGYIENQNLFVFPYDWRLDIRDDMDSLKSKIVQILAQTGANKIDIIAHSMGGLLAKYYIKNFDKGEIDKFIDIATPHLGAPNSAKILLYGDDLDIKYGIFGLNPKEVKKISQNMPSIYQLLPSSAYFSADLPDYQNYIDDLDDYDQNGIVGRLDYEQSNEFLKNAGANGYVLDNSVNIHNEIDDMNPEDYGVKTYNIIGCKTPTIGKIFTLGNEKNKDPQFDIEYITGDGTVPLRSAEAMASLSKYYETVGAEHSTLPSTSSVKILISSLLSDTQSTFDFASSSDISTSSDNCKIPNGNFLSFHSPVDVNIYDENGNHTGPNENGDIEYSIPGVNYDIIENNKFIFLPDGQNYQIKLNATDVGSFSSHIKKYIDGNVVSTTYFSDIPLKSTSTKAEVNISSTTPIISLDENGDNKTNETIIPSATVSGDSLQDITPPVTSINMISSGQIDFEATDTDSGVLKTEYSFDGNTWSTYMSPINVSKGIIQFYSVDNAGNIEGIKTFDIPIKGRKHLLSNIEAGEPNNIITNKTLFFSSSTNNVLNTGEENISANQAPKAEEVETENNIQNTEKIETNEKQTSILSEKIKTNKKQIQKPKITVASNFAAVFEPNSDLYVNKIYKIFSTFISSIFSFVKKYLKW